MERLTHDAGSLAGQSWMPDGKALVFSSNRAGLFQLWRISAEGGTPKRLSHVPARDPGFPHVAPDGSRLLFEEWTLEVNLWQAAIDSPDAPLHRTIASTWLDEQPALSPGAESIAFVSTRSGTPELWRARSDGSEATRLTAFNGPSVGAPTWSPGGRWIAFEAFVDNQADLYVLNAEGGRPRRLTTHGSADRSPQWSRDGRRLYFSSDRTGTWQIWEIPAEGGAAGQATQEGGRMAMESPDGQTLYVTRFAEPGLWAVPRAGGPAHRLTDRLDPMDWGNWAITDAGLFFVERTDGPARLMHLDPNTGTVTPLSRTLDQLVAGKPGLTLSQDGQTVLYARIERSESDLVEVNPLP